MLLLTLFLLIPLIINSANATLISYNITDVLDDSYVQKSAPTSVLGGLSYWLISEDSTHSTRAYISFNISSIPQNVTIVQAQMCASVTVDQSSQNVSAYHLLINDWSEGTLNWNNQPCGTNFTNSTYCNLTVQDTTQVNGYGWFCWNVTKCVTRAYNESDINASWVLKTPENSSVLWDSFSSKEGSNIPYLEITYEPLLTNLTLEYEDFFAINENNLVTVNYTTYGDSLTIENATCYFDSTTGSANMTYNATSELYEIIVIPDTEDVGIVTFNVTCSKLPFEPQFEEQTYTAGVFAGTPYNITIGLYSNLTALPEHKYIDEFAYIMLHATDYNCTSITGYENCWRISPYTNGISNINSTIAIGNFSIYFYSGSVTQTCTICPPYYETFTNLKHLGNFRFNENRTELYLYVSAYELNWERALMDWMLTTGVGILGLAIALTVAGLLAIIMFAKGGQNVALSVATFIITVWIVIVFIEITFGINLGLSSIMNLILP